MAMVIELYVGTLTPASIFDDVLTAELDTLIAGPNYTIEEQWPMRISRKVSIILVISVALNLLLGGSIASHWLSRGDGSMASFRGPLHHTAARETLSDDN